MKFAFAATLLLTATSGVVARGWPNGIGFSQGSAVPKGPWDYPDARSKCKYTHSEAYNGGGIRSRYQIRIKDYRGDAGSLCHRLWENLRRWSLECTPNSFEEWKPSCGMEDGDLAWRFENSQYCTEGMVESTWWEVTKNEHGGILCRDFAVDINKKGCKHCPLMDEPFWTNTVWDKKNGRKNGRKNGNRDDAPADDLLADDLLADDLLADDLLADDLLADDLLADDLLADDLLADDLLADDLLADDLLADDLLADDLLADDLLPKDLLANDLLADDFNLDKDDEKEDEDVVGKDDEA